MMKWCEASRLTGMPDIVLKYGSHRKYKVFEIKEVGNNVPNGWV